MKAQFNRIKVGWLIVILAMAAVSIIGLRTGYTPRLFSFGDSGNHLWANVAWMITATIFVLMMTPGLSFFYGGMVRPKNVISTMLQSFIVMGVVSVIWVVFGFGLAFGNDIGHVIGNPMDFFMMENVGATNISDPASETSQIGIVTTTIPLALFALFQMKFAIITPSLITGAFAERVKFTGYLLFMVLWTVIVYCPLAHCTWHPDGLFGMFHVHDYAGGIVVHAASGIAALAGAMFLGKRQTSGKSKPANVPFVLLGAALLWLGWFGFNGGSSLAADGIAVSAFLNTNTAAAVGMVTWIGLDALRGKKPSAMEAAIGAVVGLVAITPCAGWVTTSQSILISIIITLCCNMAAAWKRFGHLVDDALDVFPTHGLGGILGTLLSGIFAYDFFAAADPEGIPSRWTFFGNHVLVMGGVFIFTFGMSYLLYWITNKIVPMRVSEYNERIGLDSSQHNEEYGAEASNDSDTPSTSDWFHGIEEN